MESMNQMMQQVAAAVEEMTHGYVEELKAGVAAEGDSLAKLLARICALETSLDNVHTLLATDDELLDEWQEVVNAIKANKSLLTLLTNRPAPQIVVTRFHQHTRSGLLQLVDELVPLPSAAVGSDADPTKGVQVYVGSSFKTPNLYTVSPDGTTVTLKKAMGLTVLNTTVYFIYQEKRPAL
ncbi:hypothetical protein [Catalinimonas alkaloidigena]|nr:hypothetical protein [Catalinimonas alkaloidigena]